MIILVLGVLGLCMVWSRYKTALGILYAFSMYWAYTLYQSDLVQMIGPDAFYWSGAVTIGLGSILYLIVSAIPGRV